MSYIVQLSVFRGNLVEMLGQSMEEAVSGLIDPVRKADIGGMVRLEWHEIVEDSGSGERFDIFPTARVSGGFVAEVGIRADRFFFVVDEGDAGTFWAAVPKKRGFRKDEVNWVRKRAEGEGFENIGVEP